jgi:hypothetical protein
VLVSGSFCLDETNTRSPGRREVEAHVRVTLDPAVVFGLVGIEVVEHDVDRRVREMRMGNPMTKTPGEYEPPKQISKAEREARKAFRQVDAAKAMSEHALAEKAFSRNRERLKAERLAREAAAPLAPKTTGKPKAKGK